MTQRGPFTAGVSSRELSLVVALHAACSRGDVDPDSWFPVSVETNAARREAAQALTVCLTCLVRAHCLELSLRHWAIGQHGVWGGTLPSERKALRRRLAPVPRTPGAIALDEADTVAVN